ncbi:hypothetical protein GCM10011529_17200 [Polymorphobacter glacialis]|uniref:DUF6883 domain-containing protein n=1 Tax=Sandarakinorhabdus glacialis TaxID=1614636 RepID=A0A916ZS30_9SPHN|nr:hypothetical protein GCM10011529_17200 [Polymorphobacter glacialis]
MVPDAKVRDYLLNPDNLQNGGKAGLFASFGFAAAEWSVLAAALSRHVIDNEVVAETISAHGTKYVVRCNLMSPDGRNPCMTSVWIVDVGGSIYRLVTAF